MACLWEESRCWLNIVMSVSHQWWPMILSVGPTLVCTLTMRLLVPTCLCILASLRILACTSVTIPEFIFPHWLNTLWLSLDSSNVPDSRSWVLGDMQILIGCQAGRISCHCIWNKNWMNILWSWDFHRTCWYPGYEETFSQYKKKCLWKALHTLPLI